MSIISIKFCILFLLFVSLFDIAFLLSEINNYILKRHAFYLNWNISSFYFSIVIKSTYNQLIYSITIFMHLFRILEYGIGDRKFYENLVINKQTWLSPEWILLKEHWQKAFVKLSRFCQKGMVMWFMWIC